VFFWSAPFLALIPNGEVGSAIWGYIGVVGAVSGLIIAIWTPRWAKPRWQQYLEDTYSKAEIRRYIPVWRVMDAKQWSNLLDT